MIVHIISTLIWTCSRHMNMFIISSAYYVDMFIAYDCPHNKHSYMNMFKAMIVHIISTLI